MVLWTQPHAPDPHQIASYQLAAPRNSLGGRGSNR